MKKIIVCLLAVCTALSFAACSRAETEKEEVPHITVQTTEQTTEPATEFKPGPYDSEKLIWLTKCYELSESAEKPRTAVIKEDEPFYNDYREFLDLLKQNGVEKKIELKKLILPADEHGNMVFANPVEAVISSGEQIDIIEYGEKPLSWLMDLSDYFNTDKGKAVKKAVSENIWRGLGEPEGKHYFVPMKKVLQGQQNGYVISTELMKKNGLTESDLTKGISELAEVFEKAKSKDYSCYIVGPALNSSIIYPRFAPVDSSNLPFLMIDTNRENGMIENIYDNDECTAELEIMSDWGKKKIIFDSSKEPLLWNTPYYGGNQPDSKVTPVGEVYAEPNHRVRALAISKTSQNADAAFDVLALTVLNPEISMALNPYQANIVAPEVEIKIYDSFGFYADFAPVQKEYDECLKIINTRFRQVYDSKKKEYAQNFGDPWHGEMADVELGLKELNAELKAAGLDKVVEELNRQLDEFYNSEK